MIFEIENRWTKFLRHAHKNDQVLGSCPYNPKVVRQPEKTDLKMIFDMKNKWTKSSFRLEMIFKIKIIIRP